MQQGRIFRIGVLALASLSLLWTGTTPAQDDRGRSVLEQADQLTKEILDLGFDIYLLEESIFFNEEDQLVLLIRDDQKRPLQPSKIQIKVDGESIYNRQLSAAELAQLKRDGVLPIIHPYLAPGTHELDAIITPSRGQRTLSTQLRFFKGGQTRLIDLQLGSGNQIKASAWE